MVEPCTLGRPALHALNPESYNRRCLAHSKSRVILRALASE